MSPFPFSANYYFHLYLSFSLILSLPNMSFSFVFSFFLLSSKPDTFYLFALGCPAGQPTVLLCCDWGFFLRVRFSMPRSYLFIFPVLSPFFVSLPSPPLYFRISCSCLTTLHHQYFSLFPSVFFTCPLLCPPSWWWSNCHSCGAGQAFFRLWLADFFVVDWGATMLIWALFRARRVRFRAPCLFVFD